MAIAATGSGAVALHSQKGDAATLTLPKKTRGTLAREHVTMRAQGAAKHGTAGYTLPDTAGSWNFTTASGTVKYNGKIQFHQGKRSVTIGSVSITRPQKGNGKVTALVAGKTVQLFTLKGRVKVAHSGSRETLTGLTASLTKAGAAKINKALHRNVVKTGESFGAVKLIVTKSGATLSAGHPSSGVGFSFAPEFSTLTGQSGIAITPLGPASNGLPGAAGTTGVPGVDGTSVTFPVAGSTGSASFDQGTATGTIPLSGGLTLGNGTMSASLTNPTLTLGTGTEGSALGFSVNGGPEVKLFDIDTSQIEKSTTSNGSLDLQGLLATVSTEGAATLNSVTGTQAFTTGEPVGGLTVILPASPGQGG